MQLVTSFAMWGATGYYLIVPFLFVLTIVVLFHELGHFFDARLCDVTVHVFSIGFGRELCGLTDRHGTRWKVAAIPLGGYVKWADAASAPRSRVSARTSEDGCREMSRQKPLIQRAVVFVAGPLANFLLAVLIFAGVAMFYGRQEIAPHVDAVAANGAAAAAGFEAGDRVISIDGR